MVDYSGHFELIEEYLETLANTQFTTYQLIMIFLVGVIAVLCLFRK